MRLVDDKYFVPVASGAVANVLPQLAHLVDAAVGGSVDFDHVDARARCDLATTRALAAGLRCRAVNAVQAAGDDARDGGLTCSALPGKNVAVRNPLLRDRIL